MDFWNANTKGEISGHSSPPFVRRTENARDRSVKFD